MCAAKADTDAKDVLGQSVRSKLVDDQVGVPLHLDFQIIDVNTCEPVQGVFLEIWSVNATGVYSGALAPPNGSGMGDRANLDRNFLRGVQQTDSDGVAQFSTLFPGHYSGRATHVHVASHFNATAAPNGTMWHTTMTHVGQVFFDQELVDSVEKLAPYNTNRQPLMRNNVDNILLQEAATSDPFFHYRVLGDDLHRDGVLAWFRFGVNVTFTRDVLAVAMRFSDGGKMVTTNPRVFPFLFPGGFPTAYMPGFGGPAAPAPAPTGKAKGKGMARRAPVARPGTNSI